LATLPVAMPEEAALELDRCVGTLGFKGTMLCGKVGERNLDDPTLSPIWGERGWPGLADPPPSASARYAICP
jgi:predicted TIM-barrel fold metal-dependent hydrolase